MQDYLMEVLGENRDNEEIFYTITDYANETINENGFDDLTDVEKKIFMISTYLTEVNNGGFDQYFLNTKGVYARDTADFLDYIGDDKFSRILDEAISIFKAVISDDKKMREFDKLDNNFYDIGSDSYDLLYKRIIEHFKNNLDYIK
ncbi:DMP19 family protein [Anaerocolumna sp. MB42-C2]|uniref:DMP19 family protein n=1 Tax=Anaerocolumna sp. MB42-C2 TaxID=3070997 RepID=UPI0027DF115D|nr:DUF4375 domain-containing protein [Anaerocolumna sp. MB42-C2]WMJ90263.1 DUF4375 domain-containing protein [Anaerocolumna sp. MB42-C2]